MVQKVKSFWERKSTEILIGIIIIMFGGGLRMYHVMETRRHTDLMDLLRKIENSDSKQNILLTEIALQFKIRFGYDIVERRVDSSWIKLWNKAEKERKSRGGTSSKVDSDYEIIQYAPEETEMAKEIAK